MNVNKKFDRLRQWGKERLGGEVATTTTEDFKALEAEMELRHQGMDRMQSSTNAYIKSLSKRDQGEGKDKQVAVGHFGSTLAAHGDDFEADSEFGQCLVGLGRAHERIARMQETYCANATSSWLESVERSQVQMKELASSRRKLEQRRLAYDTASNKMQKIKREDFRMEEELRAQKAKYEESNEEVWRRMCDVKESESDSVADLTSFLDAELAYYERCREILTQVKRDWPASVPAGTHSRSDSPANDLRRQATTRSRVSSNATDRLARTTTTASTIATPLDDTEDDDPPHLPSRHVPAANANTNFRPHLIGRSTSSFEARSFGPGASPARVTRVPTDPPHLLARLHPSQQQQRGLDELASTETSSVSSSSSMTPHVAAGSAPWAKKAAPPPPPSRSTKPKPAAPPPPPPLKRNALSATDVRR